MSRSSATVAKSVDATDSKSVSSDGVPVRFRLVAPRNPLTDPARVRFAWISRPDVGSSPWAAPSTAIDDFGPLSLNADACARAAGDGDVTAAAATGHSNATMESILAPEDMATVRRVGGELDAPGGSASAVPAATTT